MAHLLNEARRRKGELGDGLPFKERVEKSKHDKENGGDDGPGLELGKREIACGFLERRLDAIHLLGFGLLGEILGRWIRRRRRRRSGVGGFHELELFGGFVDGRTEGFVGGCAVDEKP